MPKVIIRTAYDEVLDKGLSDFEPTQTVQDQRDDCDVNVIVDRYVKTGILPGVSQTPVFADVFDAPTYQESLHVVMKAQEGFMALDAKVRKEFDNDPAKFLAAFDDPTQGDLLVKLGLLEAKPIPDKGDLKADDVAAS